MSFWENMHFTGVSFCVVWRPNLCRLEFQDLVTLSGTQFRVLILQHILDFYYIIAKVIAVSSHAVTLYRQRKKNWLFKQKSCNHLYLIANDETMIAPDQGRPDASWNWQRAWLTEAVIGDRERVMNTSPTASTTTLLKGSNMSFAVIVDTRALTY